MAINDLALDFFLSKLFGWKALTIFSFTSLKLSLARLSFFMYSSVLIMLGFSDNLTSLSK